MNSLIKKGNIEIIKQLPITDIDPEYLNNIKFIKEHKIIDYFLGTEEENKFYQIIIEQVTKISQNRILDLKNIFDIFPVQKIKKKFALLISAKIKENRSY